MSNLLYVGLDSKVTRYSISGGRRSGNDILTGGGGNDTFDGGSGVDTVTLFGARSLYTITKSTSGYSVSGPDGADTFINIERVQFTDAKIALDTSGNAGQAYRLYQASFNRVPDKAGLAYWITKADSGVSLTDIATGFTHSQEFLNTYGANLTDQQFVNQLYQNVLHRGGEASGVAHWNSQLDGHAMTREQVLISFSESAENQAALIGVIQNGIDFTS